MPKEGSLLHMLSPELSPRGCGGGWQQLHIETEAPTPSFPPPQESKKDRAWQPQCCLSPRRRQGGRGVGEAVRVKGAPQVVGSREGPGLAPRAGIAVC